MKGKPVAEVNAGLKMYPKLLAEDGLASKRVETAVMSFGGSVKLEQDFATVENFAIPELTAGGDTPMSEAILRGLDLIEARIQVYEQNSVSYRKPWMFLLSDGAPTDKELWPEAVRRVREEERAKRIEFFSIGIGEYADMDRLAELSAQTARPASSRPVP